MNIINLTPHAVNFINGNETTVYPASGYELRVTTIDNLIGSYPLPIVRVTWGELRFANTSTKEVCDKPPFDLRAYDMVIVSRIAKDAISANWPQLADKCVCPHNLVRNENGQIIGCTSFAL